MIYTINAVTKATSFDRHHPDHITMARNQFGDATPGYLRGWIEPNYPMPALITKTYFWPDLVVQFTFTGQPKRNFSTYSD